jgi:hypothetical protein
MSSAQIDANRQNSQSSTGPTTEAGKQRAALNSTRHGFTGQSVVITADEKDAYERHCISFLEQYQPRTHEETELVHQYADQTWSIHQLNVQQISVMTLLNAATNHHMKAGSDFETLNAAVAPFYKQINTLGIYEQRRRRAAIATLARFQELAEARQQALVEAAQAYKTLKAQDEPFHPEEFGFVCSTKEIENYLVRAEALKLLKRP